MEHAPVVPRSTDEVQVTCRASSVSPLTRVDLLWHLDGSATVTTVQLHDDGLSGDGAAGDGLFGGSITPQAAGRIVAFQVRATAQDGQTATLPRSPAVAPYTGFKGLTLAANGDYGWEYNEPSVRATRGGSATAHWQA